VVIAVFLFLQIAFYLFEENSSRSKEEKFKNGWFFIKTKNKVSSFEYIEALPRGLSI